MTFLVSLESERWATPCEIVVQEKVLIDHHQNPKFFASYVKWDVGAAATCELIYDFIEEMGHISHITTDIANCLYAGILTDTGSFKHPNTTENVHRVVAELIKLGANNSQVSKLIYDSNSVNRVKFLGFALSERLIVFPEYRTAYLAISADDLNKFNYQTGDTEGLVNYALSIENIVFAALIVERSHVVKISFRSVGNFSVSTFASKHFEGGGHKNASGGRSVTGLETTVKFFNELLLQYKNELLANTPVLT